MYISNKNGVFNVDAKQYNWLMATFTFNEINQEIVSKTGFICCALHGRKKADDLVKNTPDWKNKLK